MNLCVLGSGSWGITLAVHLRNIGHDISLWAWDPAEAINLDVKRENAVILPGIVLQKDISVTNDLEKALSKREGVVFTVPSHGLRETAKRSASHWPTKAWALSAGKGLEENTHLRLSEILRQELPKETPIAVLSGPSHAEEVSLKMPTSIVTAADGDSLAKTIQKTFHADYFRVYTSADMIGIELGGALKNVIAIAAGILDGLGMGDNTKAALISRGLHEITRLGMALGAQASTFSGLAGIGDLIVTCVSRHSRNRLLGEKIGKGATLEQALKEMTMVAEGVKTCKAVLALAQKAKVEVPISQEVHNILFNHKPVRDSVASLLSRSAKPEQSY